MTISPLVWFVLDVAFAVDLLVPHDYNTVREAVADSEDGDRVLIDALGYASIIEADSITIDRNLTVQGIGQPLLRQGNVDEGFFKINNAVISVTLQGLTFDGENVTPALRLSQGRLVVRDVLTMNTNSVLSGGAIQVEANIANVLEIEDSTLLSGDTDGEGGLIAILGGSLTIRRSVLSLGEAPNYGGLISFAGTTLLIEDSTLEGGTASQRGGGLYARGTGAVTLRRSRFDLNTASAGRGGGGLYSEGPSVTVEDGWFTSNTAGSNEGGGAVYHRNNIVSYARTVFCNNSAVHGGAIYVRDAALTLNNGVMLSNTSTVQGGSVWLFNGGDATLQHVSISSSSSASGQAVWADGALTLSDTYIADHAVGPAVVSNTIGDATTSYSAYWNNTGGDFANTTDAGNNLFVDSLIPAPLAGSCNPYDLLPPAGSPLLGAGTGGSDIGAFDGPDTWLDVDGDGFQSIFDCDDANTSVFPGAIELPGDGVDQDCDNTELCYTDEDGDGYGALPSQPSDDLDCDDPGEFSDANDTCLGFDDDEDQDNDEVPDGCDTDTTDTTDTIDTIDTGTGTGTTDTITTDTIATDTITTDTGATDTIATDTGATDTITTDTGTTNNTSQGIPPIRLQSVGCQCNTSRPSPALLLLMVAVFARRYPRR